MAKGPGPLPKTQGSPLYGWLYPGCALRWETSEHPLNVILTLLLLSLAKYTEVAFVACSSGQQHPDANWQSPP